MIDGVKIKELTVHRDDRGLLMEILRKDDSLFRQFGQVYMTVAQPGFAKAWHYHKKQYDHFCCLQGSMRLVMYDGRDGSPTKGEVQEIISGVDDKPVLVQIPPYVYHGFEAVGDQPCTVVNTPTEPYNADEPDEFRVPFNSEQIPFKWTSQKGG